MRNPFYGLVVAITCVIAAVVIVLVALPGKKSPLYPKAPTPTVTSSQPKSGQLCSVLGQERAAADDHTYKCTKFSDGKYRWKRED